MAFVSPVRTCLLILVAMLAPPGCSRRGDDRIILMAGGLDKQIYLPALLAERIGAFRKVGLDVELLSTLSDVEATNELLAGAVHGVVGFYNHTIDLQARGKQVECIVQLARSPGEVVLVARQRAGAIHSPADFRGRTLGVTGLGSSTNLLMKYLASRHGVTTSEFTVLPVGAGTTFITAMQQGRIDVGMTTEPTISRLLQTGDASILIDLRTPEPTAAALGGPFPAACVYVQTAWLEANRATARRLAAAFVAALWFIDNHSAAEIADQLPVEYLAGDRDLYVRALAETKAMFTRDGAMPAGGPEHVLAVLAAVHGNLKGKAIDLSKTFTSEFLDGAH
jgi:NitT/TauT family transport system substrate-binding protein